MSAKPQRDSETNSNTGSSSRDRLPFEPAKNRKQSEKKEKKEPVTATAATSEKPRKGSNQNSGIPEAVSKRMVRRMAWFCGLPTLLGISTFIVSYLIVSNDLIELPHVAVVLVSMGFFGLGVLGLSYGVLSASWEDAPGSFLGFSEFTTNVGRMTEAWRSTSKKS